MEAFEVIALVRGLLLGLSVVIYAMIIFDFGKAGSNQPVSLIAHWYQE